MENVEIKGVEARRSFLKKVAYVAPAVVVLGSLTLPSSAQASVFHGTATVNPGNIHVGDATVTGESGPGVVSSGTYQKEGSSVVTNFTAAEVNTNTYGLFDWAKAFFPSIG